VLDLLTDYCCWRAAVCWQAREIAEYRLSQMALGQSYDIQTDAMLSIPEAPLMKAPYVPVLSVHCVTDI